MNASIPRTFNAVTRMRLWSRRVGLRRKLAVALMLAAVVSGLTTVALMSGMSPLGLDPQILIGLLYLDVVLLLVLGVVVAWRVASIWVERRRGMAGSGLHRRLVVLFSVVAVTPAIVVALFAALFLNFGIRAWFDERVRTAVEESRAVARAYLLEHQRNIRADILAMANDLNRQASVLARDRKRFNQIVATQAILRSLPEALVVDGQGRVLARTQFSLSLEFDLVTPEMLQQAREREFVLIASGQEDRVRAIVKLEGFVDGFLLVGRQVEARVLDHIVLTERAVAQYQALEARQAGIQITFILVFVVVALLMLLAAGWMGLTFATQLARPISNLIGAAEKVRAGDLSARVQPTTARHELGALSRAFNRMTGQLETQRQSLLEANRELDERRRFTETVLAGVSAGVIGLDGGGSVNLPNRRASELLDQSLDTAVGSALGDVVPELAPILSAVMARPERAHRGELMLTRGERQLTLLVSAAAERLGGDVVGYVVTFDDITELLSAQRKAAWADVARRIAHEIKNPLTPIQLSAERLKRRYAAEIKSDPETFAVCTETIIRQVEEIGRMVDEFSSFARMPQATLKPENLTEICRQAVFLERSRLPAIEIAFKPVGEAVWLYCDRQQVGRALTNVLKNAAESIALRGSGEGASEPSGRIALEVVKKRDGDVPRIAVVIEDDGVGLPERERDRLTEPYVTTREKGTGLGLAIVKKIMEDHFGDVVLEDRPQGGARVTLVFGIEEVDAASAAEDGEDEKGSRARRMARALKDGAGTAAHGS
ncbi:MAG: PAS domain-containing sensor histidine kinase [Rhodospirillales bacterium]|jgi:two-component system nitrogen regulation sensor histidine kinase NtrY|nr:PAS domain-containing sensor histidine kinase [Rhodospirillales bacterium]